MSELRTGKEKEMKTIYEGAEKTAKRVRQILKPKFPGIKFSVRSEKYSGGSSVHVRWADGPLADEVEKAVKWLESADFDGQQDLKTSCPPVFVDETGEMVKIDGADFIFCQREMTAEYKAKIDAEIVAKYSNGKEILNNPGYWRVKTEVEKGMKLEGKL